ncbi:DOPA-like domain-containing protein [Terfezia claveryi]|nr:DOPA-like domain-containing protein [Terfezia claveryi]
MQAEPTTAPTPVPLPALPSLEVHSSLAGTPPTATIAPSSSPVPSPYPPYPYLLSSYQHLPPLPDEKSAVDGSSYINPPRPHLSEYYSHFPSPTFTTGTVPSLIPGVERPLAAWDVHIYFPPPHENNTEALYARHLWERIRYEFPELRIYRIWEHPVGPHLLPMFEVNIFTPLQFGAFVPWLAMNRGPLSVLVHPNTDKGAVWDHSVGGLWLGEKKKIDFGVFKMH